MKGIRKHKVNGGQLLPLPTTDTLRLPLKTLSVLSEIYRAAAAAATGSSSEMQNLRPRPSPAESDTLRRAWPSAGNISPGRLRLAKVSSNVKWQTAVSEPDKSPPSMELTVGR